MNFAIASLATLAWTLLMQQSALTAENVGMRRIEVHSPERHADMPVTIWYPAEKGGYPVNLGESIFFVGTQASRDAPIRQGKYPVILLSHGAGLAGNPEALSWLAIPLAEHGFVVAAPAHPGNSGPNRSAAETMKLWLRPQDITDTLNAVEMDASLARYIEPHSVGMLGLSMGGNTALAIAGARIDPQRLASYCDTDMLNQSLCGWIRQSGVDLHSMDPSLAGRSGRDRRIGFAMAIDPAPVDIFDFDSLTGISIPVELVNLGRPETIPLTIQAGEIARTIPKAGYATIDHASHYSMFAECKPGAAEIAETEDIGDPICLDGEGRNRGEIHRRMIEMVIDAFDRALKPGR